MARVVLQASRLRGPAGGPEGLANMLRYGNGLWLAGKSKLRQGSGTESTNRLRASTGVETTASAVHVALGSDAKGLEALLATLSSILRASAERSRLVIHVLCAPGERALIEHALRHRLSPDLQGSAHVEVLEAPSPPPPSQRQQHHPGVGAETVLNLARFHLPALLPVSVRKVLYLDIDTLVLADVAPLVDATFEGAFGDAAIAAVPKHKPLLPTLQLTKQNLTSLRLPHLCRGAMPFNAGVMLLNLDVWRRASITVKVLALSSQLVASGFQGLPGMSTPVDSQSVLNLLFQNASSQATQSICRDIEWLPAAWNVDGLGWKLSKLPMAKLCAARLLHWSGGKKPWAGAVRGESAKTSQFEWLWRRLGQP
jgi:hypothetical protein